MDDDTEETVEFSQMGIDDRILEAISKLGWSQPTPIQEKAIPLALEGKDILARARTGSGKTAAYAIAILQKLLLIKQRASHQEVRAIVLTPSKELCNQAYKNIQELSTGCSRVIKVVDVSPQVPLATQRSLLVENPDIVVATPNRLLAHLRAENLNIKNCLEMLVVDEADLVFSFGHESDVKELLDFFPQIYQAFMLSATLDEDVKTLKKLLLHNAVILKLNESQLPDANQLSQYHIKCEEEDKFALVAALLKLNLIRGKTLFFVKNVSRCYQLKLFLEQFGVKACVLNSELPLNSRCHMIEQFNKDLYDVIIASDEAPLSASKTKTESKTKRQQDAEYGVSRGIDFYNVSNIVNFDFPPNTDAYIHRVGRTARGTNQGTALSFVSIKDQDTLAQIEESLAEQYESQGLVIKPYSFEMEQIEGFRYRARDALKSISRRALQSARMKDIKEEILASEKLKSYFKDNPRELEVLRHDKCFNPVQKNRVANIPDYIVPHDLRQNVRQHQSQQKQKNSGAPSQAGMNKKERRMQFMRKRKADPLRSFEFAGFGGDKKKKSK